MDRPPRNRIHLAVTSQRRDADQTELIIEYILRAAPATPPMAAWLLGSIAAAMALFVRRMRRLRSAQ